MWHRSSGVLPRITDPKKPEPPLVRTGACLDFLDHKGSKVQAGGKISVPSADIRGSSCYHDQSTAHAPVSEIIVEACARRQTILARPWKVIPHPTRPYPCKRPLRPFRKFRARALNSRTPGISKAVPSELGSVLEPCSTPGLLPHLAIESQTLVTACAIV